MMDTFQEWILSTGTTRERGLQRYFHGIAEARYVARRVFRIVDEQAKELGLDPLQHQTLIQVFGAEAEPLRVNDIAERLDLAPALASRLVTALEEKGLVARSPSATDRRSVAVTATPDGVRLLEQIDQAVHYHVGHFQRRLDDEQRAFALGIFAFYVGASLDADDLAELRELATRDLATGRP